MTCHMTKTSDKPMFPCHMENSFDKIKICLLLVIKYEKKILLRQLFNYLSKVRELLEDM